MNYYFISSMPCHLKINGEYVGKVDDNLKSFSCIEKELFLEFLPINHEFFPTYADVTSLDGIKIFPLLNGKIIIPNFYKKPLSCFKVLMQKNFNHNGYNYLLTMVLDGAVKFFIDGNCAIVSDLPFTPSDCEIYTLNSFVFFAFKCGKIALYGYDFSTPSPTLVFKDIVDEFEVNNPLKIQKFYSFINPITVVEEWDLSLGVSLVLRNTTLSKNLNQINKNLVPLSFMETVSVMGDLSIYLTPTLLERTNDIYEFIKKPRYLFPLPSDFNKIVSITDSEIFIYEFSFEGNLISNFIEK